MTCVAMKSRDTAEMLSFVSCLMCIRTLPSVIEQSRLSQLGHVAVKRGEICHHTIRHSQGQDTARRVSICAQFAASAADGVADLPPDSSCCMGIHAYSEIFRINSSLI